MSGGSRPVRPNAFRSSVVKAVPLFNTGELSTSNPRTLVSWQPCPFRRYFAIFACSGMTVCRTLTFSLWIRAPSRGGAKDRAPRDTDNKSLLDALFDAAKDQGPTQRQKPE